MHNIFKNILKPDRIDGDEWVFETPESKARVRFYVGLIPFLFMFLCLFGLMLMLFKGVFIK